MHPLARDFSPSIHPEGVADGEHQILPRLTKRDLVILDAFSVSGGALLFYLLSKFNARSGVVITTNPSFSERTTVFGDAEKTTALLDRLTHRCHIRETGNDSFRCKEKEGDNTDLDPDMNRNPYSEVVHSSMKKPAQFWVKINRAT